MEQPPPKQGLFSSLTMGRASRSSKPPVNTNTNTSNETLTHPLLAASTSSLNIPTIDTTTASSPSDHATNAQSGASPGHKPTGSTSSRNGTTSTGPAELANLPYRPRQRHGGGIGSAGSAASIFGAPSSAIATTSTASPTLAPTSSSVSTSPVTPTIIASGPPTTSTSTSATFALPPSTAESSVQADYPPQSITVNASTSALGIAQAYAQTSTSASLTSRLQLQSLKAAAQKIGLGNGSMGMSMIDAIFEKGQQGRAKAGEGGEWGDLLRILMGGKAILLLPTTPSSSLPMTPQTLRDHIGFISPPVPLASSSSTSKLPGHASIAGDHEKGSMDTDINTHVLVTLSGLVGTLRGSHITLESTLPADSPLLAALKDATARQTVLSSLRPTDTQTSTSTSSASSFPSFTVSSDSAVLPFPPPSKTPQPISSEAKEKEKPPPGKLGRINPFASLFGSSSAAPSPTLGSSPSSTQITPPSPSSKAEATLTPDRPLSPTRGHPGSRPPSPSPSSPKPPSLLTIDHVDNASILSDTASVILAHGEGYQVTAYTVTRPIRYAETHKALTKALRARVKEVLNKLPDKVIDKVIKIVLANTCPSAHVVGDDLLKSQKANHQSDTDNIATLDFSDPTTTGERLQDLMEGIYDDLISHYRHEVNEGLKRKSSGNVPWGRAHSNTQITTEGDKASEKEKKEKERLGKEEYAEKEASEGTEKVEALICRLLYNRLFSPLESDDARHDEALASRIAALNMLDLSLDHLGLITRPVDEKPEGAIANGLTDIVDRIGDELQKLSSASHLTPKDKAEVLIRAHKIVVDGLANMPNVELRPEGEPYRPDEPPAEASLQPDGEIELPTIHTPENQSSGSSPSSHPLALERELEVSPGSSSPAASDASDPSTAIVSQETPSALRPNSSGSPSVPQLVLSDSADDEPALLKEAMSDSVMTVTGPAQSAPLSREASTSTSATASSASSVPPPKLPSDSTSKPGTSGADLILPIIIYSVVKSNPPQLASQLMYLRRYRSAICLTGEASYAIVNLTAVVEFIEHVDLAELGLGGDSDKVMSIDDLSPIGLNYLDESNADAASIASASSRLRGRVFQVGEMAGTAAGSANKVLSGVVDSSWTALRGLMSTGANPQPESGEASGTEPSTNPAAAGETGGRPGLRPRQASTFSLASVTASVASIAAAAAARNRSRANSRASAPEHVWSGNQELQEVTSRPASVRERGDRENEYITSDDETEDEDDSQSEGEGEGGKSGRRHGRMRSTSSAISTSTSKSNAILGRDEQPKERVSLSNRLASIGVLGRLSQPNSSGIPPVGGGPTSTSTSSSPVPMPATTLPKVLSSDSLSGGPADASGAEGLASVAASKSSNFLANLTHPRSISLSSPSSSFDKLPTHNHTHTHTQGHGRRSSLLGGLEAVLKGGSNHSTPSSRGHLASLPLSNDPSVGSGAGASVSGYTVPIDDEPPIERFMNCELGDIKLSEIGVLLRDYRRLGQIVASAQAQRQQQHQHQQHETVSPQL